MIVGVDVYHDASRKGSSFAGIVSSMNDLATRYFSMVKEQKQGQEIMDALRVAFIESLIKYWEINRNWPTDIGKVLFYFKILLLDGEHLKLTSACVFPTQFEGHQQGGKK